MSARWAIHQSGADDLEFRSILQALRSQACSHWRIHNHFAKSLPHCQLDIMYIKPPTVGFQGLELKVEGCDTVFPFNTLTFNIQFSSLSPYSAAHTVHAACKSISCHTYKNTGGRGIRSRHAPLITLRPRLTRCANSSTLLTSKSKGKVPCVWSRHRIICGQGVVS